MLKKLSELEKTARLLEPSALERQDLVTRTMDYAHDFLERVYTDHAFLPDSGQKKIFEAEFPENPTPYADLLNLIGKEVDTPGLNPASPGHLAYIPGGGLVHSAFGDFLADIANRYAGIHFASPGAVEMENMLCKWMCNMVGYGEGSGGTLTSGGSIANLAAIVTARDAMGIRSRDIDQSVIYMTAQVHHCVDKAIRIAGLGEAIVRHVPMDERFRMNVEALDAQIKQDKAAGLRPWLVVASTGTTDTGAVDPMDRIADVCEAHHLWLHADAAYGGFFLLCEEGQAVIKGLERTNSVEVDPHKGLFLPYGTGAVLVRDQRKLAASHYYQANYMQDAYRAPAAISPADISPELTRHFRGLRLWIPLKVHGMAPFRAALAEKIWLCRYFYEQIQLIPGMEVGPAPELSVCIYRYRPQNGDINAFNDALVQSIHNDGRVFLSSTRLNGDIWIRLAVLSFRTHLNTIELALQMLKENILKLED
ncbi:MAG: aminotransferase class I/II-fold pyridoxal phosphate-dependent enzyme [Bacteroidia bacterium]|nr:aminotransferase class I/II-fold pyridoxal phosphate-dependent enzyme [Bacteroidia bacterium]